MTKMTDVDPDLLQLVIVEMRSVLESAGDPHWNTIPLIGDADPNIRLTLRGLQPLLAGRSLRSARSIEHCRPYRAVVGGTPVQDRTTVNRRGWVVVRCLRSGWTDASNSPTDRGYHRQSACC